MTALPHQLVWQARRIAEAHGLSVVPVTDLKRDRKTGDKKLVNAWVVYRSGQHNARSALGERLKKTCNPRQLLKIVRTAAGITDATNEQPAGADARR